MNLEEFKNHLSLNQSTLEEKEYLYLVGLSSKEDMIRGLDTLKSCSENPIFDTLLVLLQEESSFNETSLFSFELGDNEVLVSINLSFIKNIIYSDTLKKFTQCVQEGEYQKALQISEAGNNVLAAKFKFKTFY